MPEVTTETRAELRRLLSEATRKPIPGYPGYEADSDGHIWSVASNWRGYGARILSGHADDHGYLRVHLYQDGRRVRRPVHRLVALAFLGLPPSAQHEVMHRDGSRTNNRPDNLSWGTRLDNALDRERHGRTARGARNGTNTHPERVARGERQGSAKLTDEQVRYLRHEVALGRTATDVAAELGISFHSACRIVRGEAWTHVR